MVDDKVIDVPNLACIQKRQREDHWRKEAAGWQDRSEGTRKPLERMRPNVATFAGKDDRRKGTKTEVVVVRSAHPAEVTFRFDVQIRIDFSLQDGCQASFLPPSQTLLRRIEAARAALTRFLDTRWRRESAVRPPLAATQHLRAKGR